MTASPVMQGQVQSISWTLSTDSDCGGTLSPNVRLPNGIEFDMADWLFCSKKETPLDLSETASLCNFNP